MPALTIDTDTDNGSRGRSPSPTRPPMSPITPTLPAARLADPQPSRQTFTHSQADQVGIPPPAPRAVDFDSNPDVIALKSAISVLQMQRQRATADIQTLSRVKDEAMQDPEGFATALADGTLHKPPSQPFADADDEDDDEGHVTETETAESSRTAQQQPNPAVKWQSLPKPQDVVRCPPINWSKYAVVGESLDKLHAEQVANPPQGVPATIAVSGAYEFKGEGSKERYVGIAAPYAPGKDKLEKKPKSKK
ncbi:hypothetical protein S7711_01260 [Stachybotrys chartarum IBT 7711]|uniref:Uncharacterized protein n=1 Tax=Stachybotrys chartarum (strain CBS 109288 / IBT 7711) TaxID=1280523 RepID=A0A084AT59_STACB|nr:hypothetical protein S7711_01260 [Stachybotrys chartarum IBT 7711]KFA72933.1 hypothetical protein S40288_05047 [Stachybotrys chartarum IBT 40288]